jgi:hypothetical protein
MSVGSIRKVHLPEPAISPLGPATVVVVVDAFDAVADFVDESEHAASDKAKATMQSTDARSSRADMV